MGRRAWEGGMGRRTWRGEHGEDMHIMGRTRGGHEENHMHVGRYGNHVGRCGGHVMKCGDHVGMCGWGS